MTAPTASPNEPRRARPRPAGGHAAGLLLLVLLGLVSLSATAPGAGAAPTEPTMSISPGVVDAGQQLVVSVAGWSAGSASATVCGNNARRGDDDCDRGGTRTFTVADDGTGTTTLVAAPPVGCPCVVRVSTPSGDVVQTLPLQLTGAAGAAAPAGTVRQLEVAARVLPAGVTWRSALGTGADRTLEITIRNTGSAPVDGLALEAAVGRSGSSGRAVATPTIDDPLRPGEQRIVMVPFELTAPVGGEYVASGQVTGLDQPVGFRATTVSQPWALALLVLAAGLGTVGWWIGARRMGRHGPPPAPRDREVARG
jgi:sortase A